MKIALIVLGLSVFAIFIHPSKQVYEAQVSGVIYDTNQKPIVGALVNRISRTDPTGQSNVFLAPYVAASTVTDKDGKYLLPALTRRKWLHTPMEYLFAWVHCYGFIAVTANSYKTYQSEFADPDLTYMGNEQRACNGVSFKKDVVLAAN